MGLGQIMGFNAVNAGFPDAKAMYVAFADIDVPARAIVAVLPALVVLEPLRNRNWVLVAERYNGPGERHNQYDAKIAAAYAHWEFALSSGQTAPSPEGTMGLWSEGPAVQAIQQALTIAGIPTNVDGVFGPKTAAAVAAFEVRSGLPDTQGIVDQATADAILHRESDPLPQGAREVATEADLAPRSRIVQKAQALRTYALSALGLGGGAVVKGASDAASDPAGSFDRVHGTLTSTLDNVDKAKALAARARDTIGADTLNSALTWAATHPLPIAGGGRHRGRCRRGDRLPPDHRGPPRRQPDGSHRMIGFLTFPFRLLAFLTMGLFVGLGLALIVFCSIVAISIRLLFDSDAAFEHVATHADAHDAPTIARRIRERKQDRRP